MLRIGASLGLALVIITCTETTVTGPKRPGIGTAQMYVFIPFAASGPVTVALNSSNSAVLTVPASVTILANNSIVYFTVTGGTAGSVSVGATATGFRPATPVGVTVQ